MGRASAPAGGPLDRLPEAGEMPAGRPGGPPYGGILERGRQTWPTQDRVPPVGRASAPAGGPPDRLREAGETPAGRHGGPPHWVEPGTHPSVTRFQELIETLERLTEGLAALPGAPAPSVEWLEEDDLADKLQRILKRQVRRRGIPMP
ncbi:MAG: hypothetical protein HY822_19325 [Acidobacteria bacterium]|nr:hypothetical protein [Acidobacteriota bacterium]